MEKLVQKFYEKYASVQTEIVRDLSMKLIGQTES